MHAIRKRRTARTISFLVAFCMVTSLLPVSFAGAAKPPAASVLVFPVLDESESGEAGIGYKATASLEMAIDAQPQFAASRFSPHSALVMRAVSEGRLRQVDVEAGETASASLALFIGNVLGMDYVVIASVQSFDIQEEPRQVKTILSGQACQVKGNVDEATGEAVEEPTVYRAFGVSGSSQARAHYTGSDAPLITEAMRDAAYKAAKTLAGEPTEYRPVAKEKSKSWKWLLYGLAIGALIIAVNNSRSSEAPPSAAEQPNPVTNLYPEELQPNIRLVWDPPTGTTLTILKYEIGRSVDGGGFSVLSANVSADATQYTDTDTLTGRHIYQYRVRVVYRNSQTSKYTYSGPFAFTRT